MRITGGNLRGRILKVPSAEVRPTQDRVREALFSSLQCRIAGARFLDLFAGSGAVGMEALSRGAASVCWVESSLRVFKILQSNLAKLAGDYDDEAKLCLRSDVFAFMRKGTAGGTYDIIFADPPYCKKGRRSDIPSPSQLLNAIIASGILAPDGLLVLEQGADEPLPEHSGWELTRDKRYGGTRLRVFRLNKELESEA